MATAILPDHFRDTSFVDPIQNQEEGYYALTSTQRVNNKIVSITVITAYIGWDEYYKTIGITILGLIVLLFGISGLVNYLINKRIWRPFFRDLRQLKEYSPASSRDLQLSNSGITEFNELNSVVLDFAERARSEYHALKEFTENSSHELQTPIAIFRARLESLGQKPLDDESVRFLNDAKSAIGRLSKVVNKNLLLLARLHNGHFPDMQMVQIDRALTNHIEQLTDLLAPRNLNVYTNIVSTKNRSEPLFGRCATFEFVSQPDQIRRC